MTYINNTAGQCSVCMRSSRYISIQLFSNTVGLVKYPHSFQFVCLTCMRVIVGVYACACLPDAGTRQCILAGSLSILRAPVLLLKGISSFQGFFLCVNCSSKTLKMICCWFWSQYAIFTIDETLVCWGSVVLSPHFVLLYVNLSIVFLRNIDLNCLYRI